MLLIELSWGRGQIKRVHDISPLLVDRFCLANTTGYRCHFPCRFTLFTALLAAEILVRSPCGLLADSSRDEFCSAGEFAASASVWAATSVIFAIFVIASLWRPARGICGAPLADALVSGGSMELRAQVQPEYRILPASAAHFQYLKACSDAN